MTAATDTGPTPIPEPPGLPLLGHTLDFLGSEGFIAQLSALARGAGPIFRVRPMGQEFVCVTGPDLVAELGDDTRFRKHVHEDLRFLRGLAGDGLFTAFGHEPNWRKAHDILLPAFSLGAMRDYHATMLDVARALVGKWDRLAGSPVDVTEDMTRLTFDTIGRCGFDYDFGSFDREDQHPFVDAMSRALTHAQKRSGYLPGTEPLHLGARAAFDRDVAYMGEVVDTVIRERRASGDTSTHDLLGRMLHTTDPVTGQTLDDLNIRHQVITFLIAGHETTSGALSFALHYLTQHPAVLARAQAEVDALWGDTDSPDPSYGDVGKLRYVRQVLNEGLRLWPTAPAYVVEPLADTVIGGRHAVAAGTPLLVFTPLLHRDAVWGDNVELFDPERFSPEREQDRPVHAYKPFGSGERACIGRQFALHEATLVLGLLIHRFRLIDHAGYRLRVKETLTVKPGGFTLTPVRRGSTDRRSIQANASTLAAPVAEAVSPRGAATVLRAPGTALTVLYGSNLGTCAALARDLAEEGSGHGFTTTAAPLDEAVAALGPDTGPVLITTASYNGRPTDDAARFLDWLATLGPDDLTGVPYAVLGVGDRNWAATYQHVPTRIDELMHAAGATRMFDRAAADTSGDYAGTVDTWTAHAWAHLLGEYANPTEDTTGPVPEESTGTPGEPLYSLAPVASTVTGGLTEQHGLSPMNVLESRDLVDTGHPLARPKRFLRVALPEGLTYRTGDHLAVLPRNPDRLVNRALARFGLDPEQTVELRPRRRSRSVLPVDRPLTVRQLLTEFVELQAPATREQIRLLAEHTPCPPEQRPLAALAEPVENEEVPPAHSVLDLLEAHPACALPFERYLEFLPVLRPRHYSISSSAAAAPGEADLMVALLEQPHRATGGTFRGVASEYLHRVGAGDTLLARVLPCAEAFRPPADPAAPVIMISAGTGLAPFRGFIADRVHAGTGGPALCYFGCDHPDVDYLHREELEAAERAGAVQLRPAFSQAPQDGDRYVQDRITREGEQVWDLLERGARVYVCGDGRAMAPGVRAALRGLHTRFTGSDSAGAHAWLEDLRERGRYVEDVWAG